MSVPADANSGCVGPSSESAGKAEGCAGCPNQGACASGAAGVGATASSSVPLANIKHKILVLSGKGGVGKSTFSAQLAFGLASQGFQVGLLDIDICGPSIPRMLGLVGQEVHQSASGWSPVYVDDNLGVMSIGFMLPNSDDAVIWRGPKKNGLIKQFLSDVNWGDIDYLIVDTPPGTSDEHISIVQLLNASSIAGAVVITTPQEVAMADVRKELNFCKKTNVAVLGVVENMASLNIPLGGLATGDGGMQLRRSNGDSLDATAIAELLLKCPELRDLQIELPLFSASGGATPRTMAEQFQVPFLGSIPMDANLMRACENGSSFLETFPASAAAPSLQGIVGKIVAEVQQRTSST